MSLDQWKKVNHGIVRTLQGNNVPLALIYLFYVHILFLVFQFHNFPGIKVLGIIRLPGVISFLLCFIFIPFLVKVKKYLLVKLYVLVLFIEGARGVLGYTVFPDMVVNDKWQFEIWQLLLIYFLSLIVPLISIYSNGKGLRLLIVTFVFMGGLLGLWSITHAGFGPGGYLHDENDHCLLLVSLLPYPFFLITINKNMIVRIMSLGSAFFLLLGIIMTKSRGGYLGLFAVLIVFFLMSRRKGVWIASAFVLGLASLPFVPQDFWGEVESIKVESQQGSGTIQERLDTWSIVTKMWLDPKNTLFGVGLENSRFNLGDYEDSAAGTYVKSLRGRSTHSFYFQLLGDLGVYGVLLFATLVVSSLLMLRGIFKESAELEKLLERVIYKREEAGKKLKKDERIPEYSYKLLMRLHKEITFIRNLSPVIFSSWFGMLMSALGISIAYYPPFWLYCALSLSVFIYYEKIKLLVKQAEGVAK